MLDQRQAAESVEFYIGRAQEALKFLLDSHEKDVISDKLMEALCWTRQLPRKKGDDGAQA